MGTSDLRSGPIVATPADSNPQTFGSLLSQALRVFQSRPLEPQEMRDLKAFFLGIQAEIQNKQRTGQLAASAGNPPAGPVSNANTEEFGAGLGSPRSGTVDYGSAYGG